MENEKKKSLIISGYAFAILFFLTLLGWLVDFFISKGWLLYREYDVAQAFFNSLFVVGLLTSTLISYVIYTVLERRRNRSTKVENVVLQETLSSQQMLLRLYNDSPVPYLLIGEDGLIHNPNNATLRLFGVVAEEIEGTPFFKYVSGEDETHISTLPSLFEQRRPINDEEVKILRNDGEYRWVMMSIFLQQQGTESEQNGLVALVDITERKKVDQAKTEFVSLAAHQLRAPLSAIKWYSELLGHGDAGELSDKQQRYVQKVYDGNERMIDLVNMLLNVSRLELGTLAVDVEKVQPIEVVENVLEELQGQIIERNQQVERDFDATLISIDTDPKLLHMIFQNLISNASKYTPSGGNFTVSLQRNGKGITFKVSDRGIGIPKDQQGEMFKKLFRASNAAKSDVKGTGLGLYIVKKVTEALGGSISFESEVGQGSVFTVDIPL